MTHTFSLNGTWELYFHPEGKALPENLDAVKAEQWDHIPAQVPGNVELDLVRAGLEEDPFWANNLYRFRKYEFYQWWFERHFQLPAADSPQKEEDCFLCFEGLNTYATVWLNGVLLGSTHNAFIRHEFDVTSVVRYGQDNTLAVRIESTVNQARKYDYPVGIRDDENAWVRIPASSRGWDILGRFLSAGMWRDVLLAFRGKTRIQQAYYATASLAENGAASLFVKYQYQTDLPTLDGITIRVEGCCGESRFAKECAAYFISGEMQIDVPAAKLWFPKGYGDANLYDVRMTLLKDGKILDTRQERIGLRVIRLEHRMATAGQGAFRFFVNEVPIFVKGTNWVPLDALHSRDAQRLPHALRLLGETGCNMVRCWGGNLYEDTPFFDYCDENGIMVWQDFALACSFYPSDDAFLKEMETEAASVIRKLRNHASLALWVGDNETDLCIRGRRYPAEENYIPPVTRETLPRAVRMNDPYRKYLPSSPLIAEGMDAHSVPEQHTWGARAYYKDAEYSHNTASFISECGYHGCPALSTLRKMIPEEELRQRKTSDAWATHNTDYLPFGRRERDRNQLMADQLRILFGEEPEDLTRFVRMSQISQAEALKYFMEHSRLLKWKRTGVIWWNLLDGWPQISDAVVDYWWRKKLAFFYLKRSQQPVCLMLDDVRGWQMKAILANDSRQDAQVTYRIEDGDSGQVLLAGSCVSRANENLTLGAVPVIPGEQKLYLLFWQLNGRDCANHYIAGNPPFSADRMFAWMEKIRALPEPFAPEWD